MKNKKLLITVVICFAFIVSIFFVYEILKKEKNIEPEIDYKTQFYQKDNLLSKGYILKVINKSDGNNYINSNNKLVENYSYSCSHINNGYSRVVNEITGKVKYFDYIVRNNKIVNEFVLTEEGEIYYISSTNECFEQNRTFTKLETSEKIIDVYKDNINFNTYYALIENGNMVELFYNEENNSITLKEKVQDTMTYISYIGYKECSDTCEPLIYVTYDNRIFLGPFGDELKINNTSFNIKYAFLVNTYEDEIKTKFKSSDLYIINSDYKVYLVKDINYKTDEGFDFNNTVTSTDNNLVGSIYYNKNESIIKIDYHNGSNMIFNNVSGFIDMTK